MAPFSVERGNLMTVEQITEKIFSIEHRLTEVEDRSKSNTKRVNEHDEELKEN